MKKYLSLLLITAIVMTSFTSVFAETDKNQTIQKDAKNVSSIK